MKTKYRVYKAEVGSDIAFCGEYDTYERAVEIAGKEPRGLEQSLWDTARAAGHCGGQTAPDSDGEEDEPKSWHGASGSYCVCVVRYQRKILVTIYRDDVWAGQGRWTDDCEIVDCPAVLGPDQDASDECYEALCYELSHCPQDDDHWRGPVVVERDDGTYTAELREVPS